MFFVYWLVSDNHYYIGATVDPLHRLRQHNGELVGGARRTRGKHWAFRTIVVGFRTWKEALQFEWALKYALRKCKARNKATRGACLEDVLSKEKWTRNSPPSKDVPLLLLEDDAIRFALFEP